MARKPHRRSSPCVSPAPPEGQAGCWSSLFGIRRRRVQVPVRTKAEAGQSGDNDDGSTLPAYVQFVHGWYERNDSGPKGSTTAGYSLSEQLPGYAEDEELPPEILATIDEKLKELSPELRKLSLDIWHHPEVMYEERYAHDRLTAFMASHGFTTTPHYLGLDTAWRAAFTHPPSDPKANITKKAQGPPRTIGINAEMDALPGIGHACGHNLIAMSGAAVAVAIKSALQTHDVPGTVVILGTPAEEAGGGKIALLERGAYEEMDACIMSHPCVGPANSCGLWPGVASQHVDVEFFGHGAHAAAAPWEAQNALDAAFVAYAGVSALRQQIKPDHRVNGIVVGRDWAPNVIPDYAKLRYIVRAPTWTELEALQERVVACFDAAALATGCKIKTAISDGYFEVKNNDVLGREYARVVDRLHGIQTEIGGGTLYSTDFGNVTYALPAIHPAYAIPTEPGGGNHTPQFARSAASEEAHDATLKVAAGLAAVGFRVLQDVDFARQVTKSFKKPAKEPAS